MCLQDQSRICNTPLLLFGFVLCTTAVLTTTSHALDPHCGAILGKSSESVQCAMLKACGACTDMGQL